MVQGVSGSPLCVCAGLILFGSIAAYGLELSTGPNGSNAQAVHALGYTGQGVTVGLVAERHARVTHEAFASALWYDATGQGLYEPQWHDTAMAGILCSRGGALYPDSKGAAPGANLLTVKITQPSDNGRVITFSWLEEALSAIRNADGRVVLTGMQFGGVANGSSQSTLLYDYFAYEHDMVFVTASGNSQSSISVFGDTFNGITTAGLIRRGSDEHDQVGTWSNPGPTADGRRKPDVAAPSQGQWVPSVADDTAWKEQGVYPRGETSWAAPHTAGVSALLLSYADTTAEPHDGRSEVIKAVIVNTAFPNIYDKAGDWTNPASTVWHPHRGYGRIDALRALETLRTPKVSVNTVTTQPRGWTYRPFGRFDFIDKYKVAGAQNARLLSTMTWHRKVIKSGNSYSGESSLNLGLEIYDPLNRLIFADTGGQDNLRKADILLEHDGLYEIRVAKAITAGVESRAYALAFEVLAPLPGDWNQDYIVDGADLALFFNRWITVGEPQASSVECLGGFGVLSSQWLKSDRRYCGP